MSGRAIIGPLLAWSAQASDLSLPDLPQTVLDYGVAGLLLYFLLRYYLKDRPTDIKGNADIKAAIDRLALLQAMCMKSAESLQVRAAAEEVERQIRGEEQK